MGTPILQWGRGGKQPHRVMGGLLQLDFDLRAGRVRRAAAWGKAGGHEHPEGSPTLRRPDPGVLGYLGGSRGGHPARGCQ